MSARRQIFVFGSNLAGRHGKSAALEAQKKWGAGRGIVIGPTGNAYAIPTKDEKLKPCRSSELPTKQEIFCDMQRSIQNLSSCSRG